MRKQKRSVEYDGQSYKVKSDKIVIPDLTLLDRFEALIWLNKNTYPTGYSTKKANPLAGLAGAISMKVK